MPITTVLIVIPARNEAAHIGACLRSVVRASQRARSARPTLEVLTTVVLDDCSDETEAVLDDHPEVGRLVIAARCVGTARRTGVWHALQRLDDDARRLPSGVLVVNTDADCVVPADWLLELTSLAAHADLVQGEVEPDSGEAPAEVLDSWRAAHPIGRGSLHGANLAVRLDAYLDAGGFPPVRSQEDLFLVRALLARGAVVDHGTRVVTSSRRVGRAPGGFAAYLRSLEVGLETSLEPEGEPSVTGARGQS